MEPPREVYHLGEGGLAAEESHKKIQNDKIGEGKRGARCQASVWSGRAGALS